jgi:hypothetical protein
VALINDPAGTLLWRNRIRRLDADQIRDAILMVSRQLDLQAGGPSVDSDVPRRTIYTKVVRNTPDPLLRVFDAPDGFTTTAQRDVTTTATQALMLINGEWVLAQARKWAAELCALDVDDGERILLAFRSGTGRSPSSEHVDDMRGFLEQQVQWYRHADSKLEFAEATDKAWTDLCHVLLNSNEFLYVD